MQLQTNQPFRCVSCLAEIAGPPTIHVGLPFCCAGCVADGPCICSYDEQAVGAAHVPDELLVAEPVRLTMAAPRSAVGAARR